MFGLAGSQWNKTVAQQEQETTLSYFSAFHSVFWHAAELILLIPAKLWTVKFVKIQWTLQSKKEGKGDNAVSFFFFFFRPDRTPSVGYIYTVLTMIYFYTRHTSSSKIGTAQIDEQHTATFSANMLLCYAVVDFTCFRKSFESTCSKQVPPPLVSFHCQKTSKSMVGCHWAKPFCNSIFHTTWQNIRKIVMCPNLLTLWKIWDSWQIRIAST